MAPEGGSDRLFVAVIGLIFVGAIAAYAFSLGGPGGPGSPGQNQPPRAVIEPTNRTIVLGDTVSFSAAGSTDADGRLDGFAWDFGDGDHGTGPIADHRYNIAGPFTVNLTVTDDKGAKGSASTHVWVNDRITLAPGSVEWASPSPPASQTIGTFNVFTGVTGLAIQVNLTTAQVAGAKVNLSVLDPNGAEVAREARTVVSTSGVTIVSINVNQANVSVVGAWSIVLQVAPAQPFQPVVSVAYTGTVTIRYDPS